ncbi:MAG: Wzz/FepE/Etk N-terminal domain-containing protein [Bacteroidetes bacterium]|nr:Wzz/FepE/Etk N-terminal domain-containing protein [Bacteroidota bacterium]
MKPVNENLRLIKPFLRGLPIIAAVMIVSVTVARRYLKYATPMYESTARIRLADSKDGSPSSNLFKDFDLFANVNKIGAEMEVIKSKVLINQALDSAGIDITTYRVGKLRKIELYHECPFVVTANFNNQPLFDKLFRLSVYTPDLFRVTVPGQAQPVKGRFGVPLVFGKDTLLIQKNNALLAQKPALQITDEYAFIVHSRQKLIDQVLSSLSVSSIDKEIPVLRLTYKSPVAQKAADMVNIISQAYIDDYIETKYKSANTTREFLDKQLSVVGKDLSSSENAIESYRNKKRIINIRQETETDLRKIADMKVQQTNVRMNLEAITDLSNYMQAGKDITELAPNFEAYTDLLATELVKKMKTLQAEKKDLLVKYTPEHEQVKLVDNKIEDISRYLREGINNTRKNLEVKYQRLSNDIDMAEQVFNGLPEKEKTMGVLNRNFMLNEQTYNFLHAKRTEAEIATAATISFHRIISHGDVPGSPVSPNAGLLKILAGFLGFLGSLTLIYLVHAIKGKVNDSITIEKKSSIPLAASTPMLKKPEAIRHHFHKLAIQLEVKALLKPHQLITISSFSKNEGKCFNALFLARELAMQQKKVLLADTDGQLIIKGVLHSQEPFRYVNLTAADTKCANSEEWSRLMELWKKEYDFVIIKNENIEQASTGLLLMNMAEANLFLFDSRITPARMVTEAQLLNEEYSFSNMQYLLNRAGYNPNVLVQAMDMLKALIKRIRRAKRA